MGLSLNIEVWRHGPDFQSGSLGTPRLLALGLFDLTHQRRSLVV